MDKEITDSVDEVVKHAITSVALDIIWNVVDLMLESDSTISELRSTITNNLITSINSRVEALVDENVDQSLKVARAKAVLQAKLEMVSPVPFFYSIT